MIALMIRVGKENHLVITTSPKAEVDKFVKENDSVKGVLVIHRVTMVGNLSLEETLDRIDG